MSGDLNARIGDLKDYVEGVDHLIERESIDKIINGHGRSFIDFLQESKSCVLNGRFCMENDNYTFLSTNGKSVVDYFFVPHDCLAKCKNFKVTAIDDVMNMFNLQSMLNDKCKKPDHSIIEVEVLIDIQPNNVSETEHDLYNGDGSNEASPIFNRNKIPSDMFSSETCKLELINLTNNIEQH